MEDWLIDFLLRRCLMFFDLIFFGIGVFLGVGLYVVVGELVCEIVGFVIVLFFFLVLFVVLFSVFFYVELGCCIFKEGLVYVYMYVMLGEIWVFILGWILVLEYIFVGVCLVCICSEYINIIF